MKSTTGITLMTLALCASPAFGAGDPHAPATAPDIAVGDNWTYQYTDLWKHQPGNLNRMEVKAVDAAGIEVDIRRAAGNALVGQQFFTRELNPVKRGKMHFAPAFGRYAFPLEPGKTWSTEATGDNLDAGKHWRFQINGRAGDWEKVTVGAGEFDAIKVVIVGYYQLEEAGRRSGNGRLKETLWYAPAVKNFVKLEYEDTDGQGQVFNRDKWELAAFGGK